MSRFLYFLGGCAAGALAVAAVQAFTEDTCSNSSSSSGKHEDPTEDELCEMLCAEGSAENKEATAQGFAAVTNVLKGGAPKESGDTLSNLQGMDKMSEQLTSSVVGVVSEFLRQCQATTQHEKQIDTTGTEEGTDNGNSGSPITPNFGATQA